MNSSNDLQMVGQDGVLTKTICTEKRIKMGDSTWNYQNTIGLSLLTHDHTTKLKIKNHLCEMVGSTLKKVTEIIFQTKKYIIEDNYSLYLSQFLAQAMLNQKNQDQKDPNLTNDSQNKSKTKDNSDQKKTYIFKRRNHYNLDQTQINQPSRNTKNITKNFCKAFQMFLKSDKVLDKDPSQIREGIQEYSKISPDKRYNNNTIKRIIGNEILRDMFRFFLQRQAKNWISESRISDKNLHEEAINIYLSLFERMHILDDNSGSHMQDLESIENDFKQE